ncbi:MAG: Crp/Fnr family transcriptional regulator [Leptospira sp.]|nr:Crp/Fnr family transcriptional regulator [Leptospira sp.]
MISNSLEKPTPDLLKKAFSECKELRFSKGEFLFHQGDSVGYIDLLVSGKLQIFKVDGNQNEVTLTFFVPVQIVAEWAVLQGNDYPASGRFSEDSIVRRMSVTEVKDKLKNSIEWNQILIHSLTNKIETLNLAINRGLTMDSLQRVAHFLFYSNPEFLSLKQTQISSLLYLRPETFSRMLKQLKDLGCIEIQKGSIVILDRKLLLHLISENH